MAQRGSRHRHRFDLRAMRYGLRPVRASRALPELACALPLGCVRSKAADRSELRDVHPTGIDGEIGIRLLSEHRDRIRAMLLRSVHRPLLNDHFFAMHQQVEVNPCPFEDLPVRNKALAGLGLRLRELLLPRDDASREGRASRHFASETQDNLRIALPAHATSAKSPRPVPVDPGAGGPAQAPGSSFRHGPRPRTRKEFERAGTGLALNSSRTTLRQ